jgi:hypothetical protein
MKKAIILGMLFLGAMAVSAPAFATNVVVDPNLALAESYGDNGFFMQMTNSNGGTNTVYDFGRNELPYLHLHMPGSANQVDYSTWWSPVPDADPIKGDSANSTSNDVWLTSGNWFTGAIGQDNNKVFGDGATGIWGVDGESNTKIAGNNVKEMGSVSFRVAPEPISAVLFLLGGAGLVTRKLTIRKKA